MIRARLTGATRMTLARLLASPVAVVLFLLAVAGPSDLPVEQRLDPAWMIATIVLFLGLEASDILDGIVARRTGSVSELGKVLDPLADSLNHMGMFLCLLSVGLAPVWLLIVLFYREAVVGTLRVIAAHRGIVVAARWSGKLKSIGLGGGAAGLLVLLLWSHHDPGIPTRAIARVVAGVLTFVAVLSLADYLIGIGRALRRADNGSGSPR